MASPADSRVGNIVQTLTTVAGLCLAGWLAFALRQVSLVRRVGDSQLDGVWEQRLEVLSFIVLAPNITTLVPAAAAAAAATWLAGPTQELALAVLLRLIRWSAALLIAVGVASVFHILVDDLDAATTVEDIALRAGGILIAAAMIVLCRGAGRTAPGG